MPTSPSADRRCTGGPLDGRHITITGEHGFLAADLLHGRAWRYLPAEDGTWRLDCSHDNTLIYPGGPTTGERLIDWERLPTSADLLPVVNIGDSDEAYAGDPCDDGWEAP